MDGIGEHLMAVYGDNFVSKTKCSPDQPASLMTTFKLSPDLDPDLGPALDLDLDNGPVLDRAHDLDPENYS